VHADPIYVHITLINSSSDSLVVSSLGTITCTRGSSVYTLPRVVSTSPEMSSSMNQSFLFPPCILLLAATTPMSDSPRNNAAANPSNTPAMTLFPVLDLDVQVLVPQGMPQAPVLLLARPSDVPPPEVHAPEPLQVAPSPAPGSQV
jgi:hypothetical protein